MKSFLAVAALAAACTPAAAGAQTSHAVAVRHLDLSRQSDVAQLDRMIASAARRVCAEAGASAFGTYAAGRRCARETRNAAADQRDAAVRSARNVALAGR